SMRASSPKTLNIAIIADLSGPLASILGDPAVKSARAAVSARNAAGGVKGYQISTKLYDTTGTTAGGVNAVRKAIQDKPFAIAFFSNVVDSASNLLVRSKIPTFGEYSPSWGVTIKGPNTFPIWGNLSTRNHTAWMIPCLDAGRSKVAIPG